VPVESCESGQPGLAEHRGSLGPTPQQGPGGGSPPEIQGGRQASEKQALKEGPGLQLHPPPQEVTPAHLRQSHQGQKTVLHHHDATVLKMNPRVEGCRVGQANLNSQTVVNYDDDKVTLPPSSTPDALHPVRSNKKLRANKTKNPVRVSNKNAVAVAVAVSVALAVSIIYNTVTKLVLKCSYHPLIY